jgi:tripartite-type tricarboxylate transporter receptor subunit TctC
VPIAIGQLPAPWANRCERFWLFAETGSPCRRPLPAWSSPSQVNTRRERHHASGTANSQKCPVLPSMGSRAYNRRVHSNSGEKLVKKLGRWFVAFCALLLAATPAASQYPNKPIRMIVPFPPGGPADVVARILGQGLAERWAQAVVIDNRAGAAGNIGVELAARASADGHTLLFTTSGPITINPSLYRQLAVDPKIDLVPVSMVVTNPLILVVNPMLQVRSVRELVEMAKSKPGQLNYASAGSGNLTHLGMEVFMNVVGISMVHVPYKGAQPAMVDVIAGRTQLMFVASVGALPQMTAGSLRALAVSTTKRAAVIPDVPAIAEFYPGFNIDAWMGLFAPSATPKAVVSNLSAEVGRILQLRGVKEKLVATGSETVGSSAEEFGTFVRREAETYARVIAQLGLKAD